MIGATFVESMTGVFGNEVFSRILLCFEVLLAEALFALFFEHRRYFALRVCASIVVYIPCALLLAELVGKIVPACALLSIFVLSFAVLPVCFKMSLWEVLFVGVAASAVQNLSYSLGVLASSAVGLVPDVSEQPLTAFVQVPVYALVHVAAYFLCSKQLKGSKPFTSERIPIIVITLISVVITYVVQYGRQYYAMTDFYWWKVVFVSIDVMSLFLLFGLYQRSELREENAVLQQLMKKESKQYDLSKQTIEIINIKCHDLKHQINALREMSGNEQQKNIGEIENSVMIYDSIAKTGNSALDVILTAKSLVCERDGIKMTYMADGKKLDFMNPADIYSLFGNALDNAVEAVKNLSDKDKRIVNFNAVARNGFLAVHIENYCESPLKFENGLPQTTKMDTDYHGFGLMSIRYVAEKYKGVMTVSLKNSMFCLDVAIPLPNEQTAA